MESRSVYSYRMMMVNIIFEILGRQCMPALLFMTFFW